MDNECTHKHGKVKEWLAVCPRFHAHYTPTDASWINQVKRWFGLITQQAIRRGPFPSVKELISKNNSFVEHYNAKTREPLNKPGSSAIRLLLHLSLLGFPKALRDSRGLIQRFPSPFAWVATAESILAKIPRLCKSISGTKH